MSVIPESQEAVALQLMQFIAYAENKALTSGSNGNRADRTWLLDVYAECLAAVRGSRHGAINLTIQE